MSHGMTKTDSMFSVREVPWHDLGTVVPDYPGSIEEALMVSGLEWPVLSQPVYLEVDAENAIPGYFANVRQDTGDVLGIVGEDYKIVQNAEAFKFLDALIGSDLHFETAGSLQGGKRVWVLARLPEFVEVGGDTTATYVFVANSHDGSMAVTAAVTPIRIVCQNTLGFALNKADRSERTYRFRHTGDLQLKFAEARQVMELTVSYAARFKDLGDRLASIPFSTRAMEATASELVGLVGPNGQPLDEDLGKRAVTNRTRQVERIVATFEGDGTAGDTRGNSPGTAWAAVNAIAEEADWNRRHTKRTNQVQRSFEDQAMKQRGLDLVKARTDLEELVA